MLRPNRPWQASFAAAGFLLACLVMATGWPTPAVFARVEQSHPDQRLLALRSVLLLQVLPREHALIRFDPHVDAWFTRELETTLRDAGATVELLPWGQRDPAFEAKLAKADIYVWAPEGSGPPEPQEQEAAVLRAMETSRIRQLHFHGIAFGTRELDGLPGRHSAAYDPLYRAALDVDYAAMRAQMDRAVAKFRAGEVRVTTPVGTDIRFRVGDREFNYQDGVLSRSVLATAKTRANRERELHPGGLRVAPLEESVNGVIVIPSARFGRPRTGRALLTEPGVRATAIRLEFRDGVIVKAHAETENEALQQFLNSDPAATRFREFALGFNPALVLPKGSAVALQHGYGAGIVRLSLGENSEHGGAVKGGVARWFLFADSTVTAGGEKLVEDGRLTMR
jgi:hypothetical protein